jgi:hypothetical protein
MNTCVEFLNALYLMEDTGNVRKHVKIKMFNRREQSVNYFSTEQL